MEQKNNVTLESLMSGLMVKRMLLGWIIGFAAISIFVFPFWQGRPEWGPYWQFRPLIITPMAGAMGALFFHLMGFVRQYGGWKKIVANIVSALVFIVAVWMGIVLGLVGTMWH